MKHLHFVQSLEPLQGGGLGRASIELHNQFILNGEESFLVSTKGRSFIEKYSSVKQYKRSFPEKFYWSPEILKDTKSFISDFDVVHGHGFYVGTNWLFGSECRKQNKSLVYHVHGIFEPWIIQRSRLKKKLVHLLFENKNFKHARLWRALTDKEAGQIRSQGITAPIVVAPNGIHLDQFDDVIESDISEKNKKRVLFLARLHPKKGLDILISAWAKLGHLLKDWELIIAGPDENGHQQEMELLINQNGLGNSIHFVGSVTGVEKVSLIKSSDIFILPSYSEGFSVAILEAMACRVPVIATDACNFPEIKTDGGGWECAVSVVGIQKALEEAVSCGEDELKERGELGRKLVVNKYQWGRIADDILNACQHYCK